MGYPFGTDRRPTDRSLNGSPRLRRGAFFGRNASTSTPNGNTTTLCQCVGLEAFSTWLSTVLGHGRDEGSSCDLLGEVEADDVDELPLPMGQ